jgi:hypothetical protein
LIEKNTPLTPFFDTGKPPFQCFFEAFFDLKIDVFWFEFRTFVLYNKNLRGEKKNDIPANALPEYVVYIAHYRKRFAGMWRKAYKLDCIMLFGDFVKENLTDAKTARIKKSTIKRISKYGEFGQTFDDVLNDILDIIEKKAAR